jgi:small subunit ribosomal protein S8
MSMNDPLADMLTRIRNAQAVGHKSVALPYSRLKNEVARVLKSEGFLLDVAVEGDAKKTLTVYLKYGAGLEPVIRGLKRESRGGLRKYCKVNEIPRVLGGLGTAVVSTSAGVMSDKEARRRNVGGELLCSVW